jgi:hypothetical protein
MKYRKLRIAWSVGWGIACVLLIVLWVRSYPDEEMLWGHHLASRGYSIQSLKGRLSFAYYIPDYYFDTATHSFSTRNGLLVPRMPEWLSSRGVEMYWQPAMFIVKVPYRYLLPFVALVASVPSIPRLRWRFSLRTLLIVTTLVAVVLGLAAYAMRTH